MSGALPINRATAGGAGASEFPAFSDIVIESNGSQTLAEGTELLSINGEGQLLSFKWQNSGTSPVSVGLTFYIDEIPYSVEVQFGYKTSWILIPLRQQAHGLVSNMITTANYCNFLYLLQSSYSENSASISYTATNGGSSNLNVALKANEKTIVTSSYTSTDYLIIQNSDIFKFKKSLRIVTDKPLPMSTATALQIAVGIM